LPDVGPILFAHHHGGGSGNDRIKQIVSKRHTFAGHSRSLDGLSVGHGMLMTYRPQRSRVPHALWQGLAKSPIEECRRDFAELRVFTEPGENEISKAFSATVR
jgi:hypothetical protein